MTKVGAPNGRGPGSLNLLNPLLLHHCPQARSSMAQTRAFAIIGPSLWNQLLPSTRSTLLTGEPTQPIECLFSFSQDCSLVSGSLALEALLIGVHCKKRYINV